MDELVEKLAKAIAKADGQISWPTLTPWLKIQFDQYARACLSAIEAEGYTLVPPQRIEGTTLVCELPGALGAVTGMRVEGDRVVCDTESGVPFIINAAAPKQD